MTIPVRCPCGKAYALPDEIAGKVAFCQICGRRLSVPPAQPSMQTGKATPPPAISNLWQTVRKRIESQDKAVVVGAIIGGLTILLIVSLALFIQPKTL